MGKPIEKRMSWHSDTWLEIGCLSVKPIGNLFYLHAGIFEIPMEHFIIKPTAYWGVDVSIDIYQLSLLFSIISLCCHSIRGTDLAIWVKWKFIWIIYQIQLEILKHVHTCLRYYATFKVRKFEPLFNKINIFLQKATTCTGLQSEQILSVNI